MTRVLLLGVPRSGTTWCGRVLGHTEGAVYVNEPDGDTEPYAFPARLGFGGPPSLTPGTEHEAYARLWTGAFAGGGRPRALRARVARYLNAGIDPDARFRAWFDGETTRRLHCVRAWAQPMVAAPRARHVVVKTVRAEFTSEWIADRFNPTVLLVERDPLNTLASWVDLGYALHQREFQVYADRAAQWGIAAPEGPDPIERQAFTYAVMATALRRAADRRGWLRTSHEHLCVDSATRFSVLAASMGLEWNAEATRFLVASDRDGTGYHTERRAAEQPERWRERLDREQVARIVHVLAQFPDLEVTAP